MPTNLPPYGWTVPEVTDAPAGPEQFTELATDIGTTTKSVDDRVTSTESRLAVLEPKVTINTNRPPLWVAVATANTATVTTVETLVWTFPSAVYKAGRAYRVELVTNIRCATAPTGINIYLRDTNLTGTIRHGNTAMIAQINQNFYFYWSMMIANATAADITRVLCMTIQSNSANGVLLQIMTGPANRYVVCSDVGLASDHSEAMSL